MLELYRELADSPTAALEEACVLSAIFALRYLSRDLAASVGPTDVSLHCNCFSRSFAELRILSIGNLVMKTSGSSILGQLPPMSDSLSKRDPCLPLP